mmetsp:Transcript_2450/g.7207  ORF Transcript_2450/g.7207 Transcript_2450/m.7207 type:complete len:295 (-) Transcript_2450:190-1074(-)
MASRRSLSTSRVDFSVLPSYASHLLARTTHARPSSAMRCASMASWSVMGTVASTTRRTTSASLHVRSARPTICVSVPPPTRALRRTPAVSTNLNTEPSTSSSASTASRVVPDTSDTIARAGPGPRNRFMSELLPTLGRPRKATSTRSRASSASSSAMRRAFSSMAASTAGSSASRTSATPWPWMAEQATGSPRPSDQNSATISGSFSGDSHLLTATTVWSALSGHLRRNAATSSSARRRPPRPSTTTTHAQASRSAMAACSRISSRNSAFSSSSKSKPPVSTTSNLRPHHSPRW